jgi:hypothetical protein
MASNDQIKFGKPQPRENSLPSHGVKRDESEATMRKVNEYLKRGLDTAVA